ETGQVIHEESAQSSNPQNVDLMLFQLTPSGYYRVDSHLTDQIEADTIAVGFYNFDHVLQWKSTFTGVAYDLSVADDDHVYVITNAGSSDGNYLNIVGINHGSVTWHNKPFPT